MELWAVHEGGTVKAGIVLERHKRKRGTALIVVLVAGRGFHEWSETVMALLEDYRVLIGAYTIEAVARAGMEKWLRELKWRPKAVVMEYSGAHRRS